MRTVKQILREFSLPFVVGLFWAWYRVSPTQSDWLSSLIANFATSFFLASWAIGQVTRIRRQHTTEDSFQGIGNQLTQLTNTQATIMERFIVLQEQTKNIPALQPLIQDLSKLTMTANTQATAANTAVVEARSRESQATFGWVSDWPLPQRLVPNPMIYDSAMGGSRGPPPVLMDSIMRFAVGETYEGDFPGGVRRAVVLEIMDEGRKGKLRFTDNGEEFTTLWAELHQAGKWRRIPPA
jgi:hypothetical protein